MPVDVLQDNLKPLVYGKGAIIKKEKANLKWDNPAETLALNLKFTSNSIKVNLVPKPSTKVVTEA